MHGPHWCADVDAGDAEPHPFTLSSAWRGDGRLLLIKELGDYTASLPARLHSGDLVRLEGPYGQFNFKGDGHATGQIWIGGGIGITPFVARMRHLALHPDAEVVDLIHATPRLDTDASVNLEHDALAAGVNLHLMLDARDGLLTAERLRAMVAIFSGLQCIELFLSTECQALPRPA